LTATVLCGENGFDMKKQPTPTLYAILAFAFIFVMGAGCLSAQTNPMILVAGGTLPAGSEFAGQVVLDFRIGRCEVTWGEWKVVRAWAVLNGYADLVNVGVGISDAFPVQSVSWYDAVKWCNAKSQKEGRTPVYTVKAAPYKTGESVPTISAAANGYRLPSEKEWERAARGGSWSKGYKYSGSNDANAVAWTRENSSNGAKAVGTKLANELGIYDMSGNVWEWCWDATDNSYTRIRGGSWNSYADIGTLSIRDFNDYPSLRSLYNGFRLACNK